MDKSDTDLPAKGEADRIAHNSALNYTLLLLVLFEFIQLSPLPVSLAAAYLRDGL